MTLARILADFEPSVASSKKHNHWKIKILVKWSLQDSNLRPPGPTTCSERPQAGPIQYINVAK